MSPISLVKKDEFPKPDIVYWACHRGMDVSTGLVTCWPGSAAPLTHVTPSPENPSSQMHAVSEPPLQGDCAEAWSPHTLQVSQTVSDVRVHAFA
jgi:hypothetical protein